VTTSDPEAYPHGPSRLQMFPRHKCRVLLIDIRIFRRQELLWRSFAGNGAWVYPWDTASLVTYFYTHAWAEPIGGVADFVAYQLRLSI
jgi:hypothetical protein